MWQVDHILGTAVQGSSSTEGFPALETLPLAPSPQDHPNDCLPPPVRPPGPRLSERPAGRGAPGLPQVQGVPPCLFFVIVSASMSSPASYLLNHHDRIREPPRCARDCP